MSKDQPQNKLIETVYSLMTCESNKQIVLKTFENIQANKLPNKKYLLRSGTVQIDSEVVNSPEVLTENRSYNCLSSCSFIEIQSADVQALQNYIADIRTIIDKALRKIHKLNNLKYSLKYEFRIAKYCKGEYVLKSQEVRKELYLFASGTCVKHWEFSNDSVEVPVGCLVGESSLIGKPSGYSIQVTSPNAYFISIDAKKLSKTMGNNGFDMLKVKFIEKVRQDRSQILKKSIIISLQNYQHQICANLELENMDKRVSVRGDLSSSTHNQQPQRLYMKYFLESSQKFERCSRHSKRKTQHRSLSPSFCIPAYTVSQLLKKQAASRLKTDFKDTHKKSIMDKQKKLKQLKTHNRFSIIKYRTPQNQPIFL